MYKWHLDPGHGWLAVPVLEVLNSKADISSFSYYDSRSGMVYLEEDCDAVAFMLAAKTGWISQQYDSIIHNDEAPCRHLPSWRGVR